MNFTATAWLAARHPGMVKQAMPPRRRSGFRRRMSFEEWEQQPQQRLNRARLQFAMLGPIGLAAGGAASAFGAHKAAPYIGKGVGWLGKQLSRLSKHRNLGLGLAMGGGGVGSILGLLLPAYLLNKYHNLTPENTRGLY